MLCTFLDTADTSMKGYFIAKSTTTGPYAMYQQLGCEAKADGLGQDLVDVAIGNSFVDVSVVSRPALS